MSSGAAIDPLGDAISNKMDFHARHNKPLRIFYDALNATSAGSVILADKSDLKHGYRKTTKYKMYNDGHVPDIIRPNGSDSGRHEIFEVKVPSALTKTLMSKGHLYAFGNTEDRMLALALGKRRRGRPSDGAFDPATGRGYVKGHDGHYADALRKEHSVLVLVVESTGGIAPCAMSLLHRLERDAQVPGARDGTAYHRHGPRTFVTHYGQRIAAAAVREDACATAAGIRAVLSHAARTATD